ncbi:Protein argonaute [Saxophila tyrrhenica]|uniref:Protein argonaute n=1 Tax=Saxophila tyrrhenica TaxID=1690608 RepID=A0AAV9PGR9_9PEZI|nr:Protein argonaute [Saxophila tyrrhenica]
MGGPAKRRANEGRYAHSAATASSSGDTSSSGKASRSVHSHAPSTSGHSRHSRQYDGNRDPGSPGSTGARSPSSRSPGSATASSRTGTERNPETSKVIIENKNLDVGTYGRAVMRGDNLHGSLCPRPAPSKLGTAIKMGLNVFGVSIGKLSKMPVYQYDVHIGSGTEKRGLLDKVWQSQAVRKALGEGFIYDGNKLAWCSRKIDRETRITVDLDAEQNRPPSKSGKDNKHRAVISFTNPVYVDRFESYLEGTVAFNNAVLETLNFLDHMLRETPRNNFTAIKRSFFARGEKRFDLGNAVEAFKGVFSSMRIYHAGLNKGRLAINVDVANGTFWTASMLHVAAVALTGKRDVNDLIVALNRSGERGREGQALKKMRRIHVIAHHRRGETDNYCIDRLVYKSAKEYKFDKDGKMISVYDYFAKEFNIRLQHPDLPLVLMTKGKNTMLPMEVLKIKENQRYVTKLDDKQTSNMIKFAVEPPPGRWESIKHGLGMLDWANDPVLKHFGVQVDPNMTTVDARLIPAPKVQFGAGDAKPGTSGRWDLKGKKFLSGNVASLKSWAVCVISGRRGGKPDKATIDRFIAEFIKIYKGHGGRVENTDPASVLASGDDVGGWVTETWNKAGNQSQMRPQILLFVLPDKDSITYGRIKRSADCRYGVVSQCMQFSHVQKCQAQYISNVCMKFNAKLGGQTSRAMGPKSGGPTGIFQTPTCIIGADVSHAAPGSQAASMAAFTMSMDRLGIRYAAACETNGFRVEMISTDNINNMLKPQLQAWMSNVGGGQFMKRIIYFRDGVSEGQYQHVLEQEVRDMKALLKTANPNIDIPFVVIVGGKRHHIRFFPPQGKGDRNGNPLPGTLVETGCTNPFENDFYLCSHSAIKGTARPMHYHVLLNEAGMGNEELQTLIYEQCYQYIKSTTPISQHPAIYYAHLASNRAVPHDPNWSGSSDATPSSGQQTGSQGKTGSSADETTFSKLMPMPNQGAINTGMWYI